VAVIALAALVWSATPATPAQAGEKIEKAGAALGVTAGNLLFVPLKAASFSMGALSGALSFLLTGGDQEVTRQVWRDTLQGPYVITPEIARKAIGERPELQLVPNGAMPTEEKASSEASPQ
jgi:hypothetical protein